MTVDPACVSRFEFKTVIDNKLVPRSGCWRAVYIFRDLPNFSLYFFVLVISWSTERRTFTVRPPANGYFQVRHTHMVSLALARLMRREQKLDECSTFNAQALRRCVCA